MTAPAIFTRQAHSFEAQELQQTAAVEFYAALQKGEQITVADALKCIDPVKTCTGPKLEERT